MSSKFMKFDEETIIRMNEQSLSFQNMAEIEDYFGKSLDIPITHPSSSFFSSQSLNLAAEESASNQTASLSHQNGSRNEILYEKTPRYAHQHQRLNLVASSIMPSTASPAPMRTEKANRDDRPKSSKLISLASLSLGSSTTTPQPHYPHVYDTKQRLQMNNAPISLYGPKTALPANSERIDTALYEEIRLPPPLSSNAATSALPLVTIDLMEEWCRSVFSGYKSLNRIQSIVYESAFNSNENLLVCAPTGAGKTDVAMLTILSTIKQHRDTFGQIQNNDFKVCRVHGRVATPLLFPHSIALLLSQENVSSPKFSILLAPHNSFQFF